MNASSLRLPLVALALSGLAACSSSTMSRIDSNRAAYETWPIEMREAVLSGRVVKGMTPDMVETTLGKPSQVITRSGDDEVWVYKKGGAGSALGGLLGNTGVSIGGGVGGVGVSTGIGGQRRPSNSDEQEVVFQKGVVVRADAGP
jgi:hypothetical protein